MQRDHGLRNYDALVIGSGIGGALAAHALVEAGARVVMLERGDWVARGPASHDAASVAMLSPHYSTATPADANTDAGRHPVGALHCVGGQSVFYAGVAFRYRRHDFNPHPSIVGSSGALWPFDYDELEPFYDGAERLLGVSEPPVLSDDGRRLHEAAHRLGLHPFQPPLAIGRAGGDRPACVACQACNGFACAVGAKGDAASIVARLVAQGLELRTGAVATRLFAGPDRVTGAEYLDLASGARRRVHADRVLLAAGALATPHLLLASGLQAHNPGGRVIGRYLTRHCNAVVAGVFADAPGHGRMSYKEFAVHDFYRDHPRHPGLTGLGSIQQEALPAAMVEGVLPAPLRPFARILLRHMAALIVLSEDEPVWSNRVALDRRHVNAFGLPRLRIHHRYAAGDLQRRAGLVSEARRILAAAGARFSVSRSIDTFSHALGTVRMGVDPRTSALDADGRFRGFRNLYVTDGSALPTSAAVNPSLTIAAHALRVASRLARVAAGTRGDVHAERKEAARAIA